MPRHSVTMIEASGNVFRQPTDPGILLDEGKRQLTLLDLVILFPSSLSLSFFPDDVER